MAATRGGLALIWKIVLVVELLGRSDGIGFQLHMAFRVFDVASILAYSPAFIAVVQLIELALLQPLERRASAGARRACAMLELRLNGLAAGHPVLGVIEGRVCAGDRICLLGLPVSARPRCSTPSPASSRG